MAPGSKKVGGSVGREPSTLALRPGLPGVPGEALQVSSPPAKAVGGGSAEWPRAVRLIISESKNLTGGLRGRLAPCHNAAGVDGHVGERPLTQVPPEGLPCRRAQHSAPPPPGASGGGGVPGPMTRIGMTWSARRAGQPQRKEAIKDSTLSRRKRKSRVGCYFLLCHTSRQWPPEGWTCSPEGGRWAGSGGLAPVFQGPRWPWEPVSPAVKWG